MSDHPAEEKSMLQQRRLALLNIIAACALLFLVVVACRQGGATSVPASNAGDGKDPAKTPPADLATLTDQVRELQKQVADLQKPRIVAAGTATFTLGAEQDNATHARVKLSAEV